MFKFFTQKKWFPWSVGGTIVILLATWYQVQLDVRINEWFGEFYDTLQKALTEPNSVTEKEFISYLFTFAKIAAVYILVVIFSDYFTSHWTFRWRTAMADFYHDKWNDASSIEGASQRVQEDTLKFARIMEGLGAELLRSLMTLIAFTPILWGLSKSITVLPWIGEVNHALVWVAIVSALGGTLLLASVGIKLPGIEYDIQKEEAAYRKELVLGEDFKESAKPETITGLYGGVRKIHYKMYFHYLYFLRPCNYHPLPQQELLLLQVHLFLPYRQDQIQEVGLKLFYLNLHNAGINLKTSFGLVLCFALKLLGLLHCMWDKI